MSTRVTTQSLLQKKQNGEKLVCLAAYDFTTAKALDRAGVDVIIIGDSLGVLALGHQTTSEVTVEQMLHHTKAVASGAKRAMVVTDLPFLSYQIDLSDAIRTAGRFIKEGGADAVKMEGSTPLDLEVVSRLVAIGIPVMAHVGCVPQPENAGARIPVKTAQQAEALLQSAKQLEAAGAFSIALEFVPAAVAKVLSQQLKIPTIGYGSGPDCDGQTFKSDDLLHRRDSMPTFGRHYANFNSICHNAVLEYAKDVANGSFPSTEPSLYFAPEQEEAWLTILNASRERIAVVT